MQSGSRGRAVAAVAAGGAVAMILAACGAQNSTAKPAASSTATGATTIAVDSALAAKVPASVRSAGVVKVGTDSTYAPNEFLDTDGKTVIGFDVDLFNAVASKLGLKAQYESAAFDSIIPGITAGKYDVGVSSFTINATREQTATMISYFSAGTQWATKKGNPAGISPDNACGKKIAVQTATVEVDDIDVRTKTCVAAGKPGITIDQYQSQADATTSVVSGKDDAMLADSPVSAYAVKQAHDQLQLLGSIYAAAPYGYVVKKDAADFAAALSGALAALMSDGTYRAILQRWGVDAGANTSSAINPHV